MTRRRAFTIAAQGLGGVAGAAIVLPAIGFAVCLLLWLNLSRTAQIAGSIWMAVGIAFGAWKTKGFKSNLVNFEIPAE